MKYVGFIISGGRYKGVVRFKYIGESRNVKFGFSSGKIDMHKKLNWER